VSLSVLAGKFIVFDGGNGAGKSTIIGLLANELRENGQRVLTTREPGGTPFAESIRELLLTVTDRDSEELLATSEVLLLLAARVQHVNLRIKPALAEGATVLCDRFTPSTIAFQCYGRGYPLEQFKLLNDAVFEGFRPSHNLLFDIDPAIGVRRNEQLNEVDAIEQRSLDSLERARRGYLTLAQLEPEHFTVINAEQPLEDVFASVKRALGNAFP
jgi:dTMP kinase